MSPELLPLGLFLAGVAAGIVAALLGVGGGILMVPMMTQLFGVPTHNALGASLVAGIAASDSAALWPGKRRLMEVGLAWQIALVSTFGATIGALVALASKPEILQAIFAVVLLYTAFQMARPQGQAAEAASGDKQQGSPSRPRQAVTMLVGLFAGASSGLLGIGGGIIIVPALNLILRKPFKTATATSNLLIGITALVGSFAYWWRGRLLAVPTIPITAGAFVGALIGSSLDRRLSSRALRYGMALLLTFAAIQMGSTLITARWGR